MATILNSYNLSGGDTTSSTFTSAGECVNIEATTTSISGNNTYLKVQSSGDQTTWSDIGQMIIGKGSDTYCNDPIKITGIYIRCLLITNDSTSGTITVTASDGAAGTGDLLAANNLSDVADATTSRNNLGAEAVANKATDFTVVNDTLYPTVKAVDTQITTALATTVITLTGQTAAIGSTLITGTDTAGLYDIQFYLTVTTADVLSTGLVDFRIAWNDTAGATFQRGSAITFNAVERTNTFGTTHQTGNLIEVTDDNGILYRTVFTVGVILTAEYSLTIVSRKIA
jgi:hypothetical protein